MSINQPAVIDEKIIENSITEIIDFSYHAVVNPLHFILEEEEWFPII